MAPAIAADANSLGKAHVPWGADGEGKYSAATLGCFAVIENAAPIALAALAQIPDSPQCFRILDLGTADGGTSLPLMHKLIGAIRSRTPGREVEITYEDQPGNEWKSLFYYVLGIKELPQAPPLLPTLKGVFITASGTPFFLQCAPSGSTHLALSFTAMHWLSAKPCNITTGVHMTQATGAELAAFAKQAAADWEKILLNRDAELVPGGQAVIANFAISPEGHWLGHSDIGPCMYGTMDMLWAQLRKEGTITEEEYKAATFINYYRTQEEQLAPLQPGGAAYKAGLRLVSHTFKTTRCPFRAAFRANPTMDPKAHAKWYVPTLRTWSNSTFLTALSASRPEAERQAIVDGFYARYEDVVASDPAGHGMDYVHCFLHIAKVEK